MALVVKYADNIHKGFSASIAIVIASVIDYFIFHDTEINVRFAIGSFLVILSSVVYVMISHPDSGGHLIHVHGSGGIISGGISNSAQLSQGGHGNTESDRKSGDVEGGKNF